VHETDTSHKASPDDKHPANRERRWMPGCLGRIIADADNRMSDQINKPLPHKL
jgi:hypothetical protein